MPIIFRGERVITNLVHKWPLRELFSTKQIGSSLGEKKYCKTVWQYVLHKIVIISTYCNYRPMWLKLPTAIENTVDTVI